MTLSEGIRRQKYQMGGYTLGQGISDAIYGIGNIAMSGLNGLQIGESLGYNQESQKTLGILGAINAGLNNTATAIQHSRLRAEERDRASRREEDEYFKLPRDRYAYDDFSSSSFEQSYYQNGGMAHSTGALLQQIRDSKPQYKHGGKTTGKRGYWTEENKYTNGTYHPANIYDSSTSVVRNKQIGKSKQGYSSAVGSHVLGSRHASYKKDKGKKKPTPVYKPTKQLDSVYNNYNNGGMINNTGYTPGTASYNNPYNIIPGNHITSKPMASSDTIVAQPIYDNRFGEPFLYRKGDRDVKIPGSKGFIEFKI